MNTPNPTPRPAPPPQRAPSEVTETARWGRIDDDGVVWLRRSDRSNPDQLTSEQPAEEAIGTWLAGTPSAGLAFYGRRYLVLQADIDLLYRRLEDGHLKPAEAMTKQAEYRGQLENPQFIGDIASLTQRLDDTVALAAARREAVAAQRQAAKQAALAAREELVAEAEKLSTSTRWKVTGDRYRAIVEEWRAAPHIDRPDEQRLWARLSAARTEFDKRRRTHFAELEGQRSEAAVTKAKLVKEAESLAASRDWQATGKRFRELMSQWKAAGPAPREDEQRLWAAFRAAQDTFFTARDAVMSERDAEFAVNRDKKLALLTEAEKLVPVRDPKAARQQLRVIQDQFGAIGMVPRADKESIENRLKAVEQIVRKSEETQWRKTNPEARARAAATVEQLESSLKKLRAELDKASASGNEKKAAEVREAIEARESWLVQAQLAVTEFSG